jgi:copper chaperone
MKTTVIKVSGMSCEHCVKAVAQAVQALPGIGGVSVDLAAGTVTVEHDPAASGTERIIAEIMDQGYEIIND